MRKQPTVHSLAVALFTFFIANVGIAQSCFPSPSGLVAWWRAEGDGADSAGTNIATIAGVTYTAGRVNQSFSLNGTTGYLLVPASPSLNVQSFTIEGWIYPTDVSAPRALFEYANATGPAGAHIWIGEGGTGRLYANLRDTSNGDHSFGSGVGVVAANQWSHVACTYNQAAGTAILYVNGNNVASANLGSFTPKTSTWLHIGKRPNGSSDYFNQPPFAGKMDEISIYNRALASAEIGAIYAAGSAGKCFSGVLFNTSSLPDGVANQSYSATITAAGAPPLTFTVVSNSLPPGLTLSTNGLLSGVPETVGSYNFVVRATNGMGESADQPFTVKIVACPESLGLISLWQGEGNAGDAVGSNHGTTNNGVSFSAGKVGQCFTLDGTNGVVTVPASSNLNVQSFTIEAWINPADVNAKKAIIEYCGTSGRAGVHLWMSEGPGGGFYNVLPGTLFANVRGINNSDHHIITPGGLIQSNQWQHIALTYDYNSGAAKLFINGSLIQSNNFGSFLPNTALPLNLGHRPYGSSDAFGTPPFQGQLDEVGIFNRALSGSEIASIYASGAAGRCNPGPAAILTQPQSQTVFVGGSVTFSVSALGAGPLAYQWRYNESNAIAGATAATLILTNLQVQDSGNYSVTVSNAYGGAVSSNAILSVIQPSNFALDLDGAGDFVSLSNSLPDMTNMTVECWVNFRGQSVGTILCDSTAAFANDMLLDMSVSGIGMRADKSGASLNYQNAVGTSGLSLSNTWNHIAWVMTPSASHIYLNGTLIRTRSVSGKNVGYHAQNPSIGRFWDEAISNAFFKGLLDEIRIWKRARTTSEIQAQRNMRLSGTETDLVGYYTFDNGTAADQSSSQNHGTLFGHAAVVPVMLGITNAPPSISEHPQAVAAFIGNNVSFSAAAAGSGVLGYQWMFNETNSIAGATNALLTINNVQLSHAGIYSVVVTNEFGSAISSNALLTVSTPPANVRVVNTSAMSGQSVIVPIVLVANGNEQGLGFNLQFPTQQVALVSVTLGNDAQSATLLPNLSQAANGRIGIAMVLSSGTFNAGTQEVLRVEFTSSIATTGSIANITFTNAPVEPQISDADSQPLPATYTNGTITFVRTEFEADVAPRPSGNYAVTITDWTQVGRFAASLDTPTAGEFQRIDCAPKATLGDGQIKATDWVQAGRYVAGLDPLVAVGGPTAPVAPISALQTSIAFASGGREIQVSPATSVPGVPMSIPVTLEAQGNETALGFSVTFDSTKLTFNGSTAGSSVIPGSTLYVNTNQTNSGKIGVLLSLPSGSTFTAGANQLVNISLLPVTTGMVALAFSDSPVPKSVSDATANELPTSYITSSVTVNPVPTLNVNLSGTNLVVSWPNSAPSFVLQSSLASIASWTNATPASLQTNGNVVTATFPAADQTKFFRLRHQ